MASEREFADAVSRIRELEKQVATLEARNSKMISDLHRAASHVYQEISQRAGNFFAQRIQEAIRGPEGHVKPAAVKYCTCPIESMPCKCGICQECNWAMFHEDDDFMPQGYQGANLLIEVAVRRAQQDSKWGGPSHYDKHYEDDWVRFIQHYLLSCKTCATEGDSEKYEDYLLDVAALAVAAIESSRRKRNV